MQVLLSKSKVGRIVLHMLCCVRTRKYAWHYAGIMRELRSLNLR